MPENSNDTLPTLAIIPGDPNGVGPELLARLLAAPETFERANLTVIGDRHVIEAGFAAAGLDVDLDGGNRFAFQPFDTIDAADVTPGEATRKGGLSILACLDRALEMAAGGEVDGIMFLPFNKAAMHMADLGHEDEIRWMAKWWGERANHVGEINIMAGLWTSRVTSHVPLKDVASLMSGEAIFEAIRLLDDNLRASGIARPRLGVAALNPHAGDGGNFGTEEIEIIAPAVARARAQQIKADGPYPSDTVFLKAKAGDFDGVVTMYHDQGQIAMKMMGFDGGVTVLAGMPVPIGTPAHGTAYDIVGKGIASLQSTQNAFEILTSMAQAKRAAAA